MKTSIDKLFFGKNIYTMVAEDDKVEAIAVKDGKIVFAGAKAEAEEKVKKLMVNAKKCRNCPFLKKDNVAEVEDMLSYYEDYCSEMKLEDSPWGIDCDNYCYVYEESDFYIKEVEVEE